MGRLLIYSFFLVSIFCNVCKAQQANILHFQWSTGVKQQRNVVAFPSNRYVKDLSVMNSTQALSYKAIPEIKYTLPKGAIFCRMEDALHQRFNIWLKVRMGTEDKYSD